MHIHREGLSNMIKNDIEKKTVKDNSIKPLEYRTSMSNLEIECHSV